jgi:hypothetical protein
VTVTDSGGPTTTATDAVTVNSVSGALTAAFLNIVPVQNQSFSGTVAEFTDANSNPADFSAIIDWGDGQATRDTITASGGVFSVLGTYMYAGAGTYTTNVTIGDKAGDATVVSGTATVTPAITAQASDQNALQDIAFSGTLASFTDLNAGSAGVGLTAGINWGDDQTSAGTINVVSGGGFNVTGSHTWTAAGSYPVGITISDVDGDQELLYSTVTVASPLSLFASTVFATQGVAFSGTVAEFASQDPLAVAGNFSAQVVWGDGQTSAGTISANSDGSFSVSATHTYAAAGAPTVIVTVSDSHGNVVASTSAADVQPTLMADGESFFQTTKQSVQDVLALVTDPMPNVTAASLSALIAWGDGQSGSGVVTADPNGGFDISAAHAYATAGTYTALVSISDGSGDTTSVADTFSVVPALSATAAGFAVNQCLAYSGTVATLTAADPLATEADFTARKRGHRTLFQISKQQRPR